jgi:hypothetical protein
MSTINNIKQAISLDITSALRRMAGAHNITDPDELALELLVHLGITDRTIDSAVPTKGTVAPPPTVADDGESVDSKDKKERKRTVSAKQKKDFLELEGATEENLKSIIKRYKDATQEAITAVMTPHSKENAFILYARTILATPAPPPPVKAVKEKVAKKKSRVAFNATELKIFKKVVESAGSTVTDELKKEFVDYATAKTDEEFAVVALEGHMRAFVDSKKQVRAGNGEMTPVEHMQHLGEMADVGEEEEEEEEDEDLVEFTHNEETLLKGVASGKIYRSTTEAGDVQVGVCGKGEFKDVSI